MKYLLIYLLWSIVLMQPALADVKLPRLISDGMVLQRDTDVRIWGWAAPQESIVLTFAGQTYRVRADKQGDWDLRLPPMEAGGPYTLEIRADNRITVKDVLIGDVWFCSGQSNMVLPMERIKEKYPDAIARAMYPEIRNFFVPTAADVNGTHADLPGGQWVATTPESVYAMGGLTFFFARQLYEKHGVPIGIINASVGGTPVQAWASGEALAGIEPYASRLAWLRDSASQEPNHAHRELRPADLYGEPVDKGLSGPLPWFDSAFQPEGWRKFWMPGYWDDQGTRNLHGVLWFRKEVDIPPAMAGRPAKLFMGRIVDADETYVNGVKVGNITYQYPPRRYEVPGGVLKAGSNVIVVRVTNTEGKGGFVPDKNYMLTDGNDTIDLRGDWRYQVGLVQPPRVVHAESRLNPQNEPGGLFNTMVAPATRYAVKGFLWYQGESNTRHPENYGLLLTTLIADWRERWGLGELPFIYAQLPNFMEVDFLPAESNWAALREQQLQTLAVQRTAMAVTIDLGEWNDIHPLNKKDVGERMALAAEGLAYGDTATVYSGPLATSASVTGNRITVSFAHTGSGLTIGKGDELCHFAIAGADGRFVWGKARIAGDTVTVWHDAIPEPRYVRYAWADNPECANLYNREGLPASPFRIDVDDFR
ncbi:sialate O-acetylesterase [Parapedobacter composti]|uniref:Sialate O-acetylesterase n=1 Tax=Parapedobacter composti TaxID=623281 RepID=A0A1I1K2E5_9SPHI|nr:sialate O-acetylesterase [Parapedobacter composti]SFC55109.1 sialate O-acetylesterase [Parapedobacter composti]